MMHAHSPGYYRDLLHNLLESIELEEARIDTLRQIYLPKIEKVISTIKIPREIESRVRSTPGETPAEQLFNWIADQDPGKNNPATQWMLDRVLRKDHPIPLEDVAYANEILDKFFTAVQKRTLPSDISRDLNRYTSLSDIEAALRKGQDIASDVETQDLNLALKHTDVLYDGPDVLVVNPKTEMAACFWGQPTDWCTAWGDHVAHGLSKQGRHPKRSNLFGNYVPLYVIINKADPNERYQLSYTQKHYMDKDNKPFDSIKLGNKFPVLWKVFHPIAEKYKSMVLNNDPSDATKIAVINTDPKQIIHMNNPSPELQLAAARRLSSIATLIKNPTKEIQKIAVERQGEALLKIAANLGRDPDEEIQLIAVENNGLAIKGVKAPSEAVQIAAVNENGDALKYIIDNLGTEPSLAVQMAAVENAPDALEWLKKPNRAVQLHAIKTHEKAPWALSVIADILATKGTDPDAARLLATLGV